MSLNSINRREILKLSALAGTSALFNFGLGGSTAQAFAGDTKNSIQSAIRLWGNENPEGPSPKTRRAIIDAVSVGNRYAATEAPELEKMIAEREGVAPESVILGTGSGEVLAMAGVLYSLNKGEMITAEPSFTWLTRFGELMGAKTVKVPLDDRHTHDLGAMRKKISANTKLVYVCNPNNPTGTMVADDELREFCTEVSRVAPVFVDEAYLEYTEEFPRNSMIEMVRKGANVIVSRTFSKIYGLAGMRIGYGLAKPEIANNLRRFRMTWLNPVSLRAAMAALEDSGFVSESRRKNFEVRAFTVKEIEKLDLEYAPSHCNSIWLKVGADQRNLPAKLAQFNILIRGVNSIPLDSDWARISIGTMAEMKVFVSALPKALKA